MSDHNYWSNLRRRRISRRTMLGASAKAGVGAAGLALVGCGGDDDDDGAGDAAAAEAAAAAGDSSAAAAAAERAAAAAEEAAAAAAAAGDAGAAAVAEAAAAAAEAAAAAAREAGADQAQAAAEAAAAAAAAAEDAAAAAREAAAAATMADEEDMPAEAAGPFAGVDLDASIVSTVTRDGGGTDQARSGSHANYISHANVYDSGIELDPVDNSVLAHLMVPEQVDAVTISSRITPAPFHDGSIFSAHDAAFTYRRAGNVAEYHDGGQTTDHPSGWTSARATYGSQNWAKSEVVDDRTWLIVLNEPDAGFLTVNFPNAATVAMVSQAYTERVGDAEMDQTPMGTGPYRFVSHTDDTDFIFERFDDHFNPIDHPTRVHRVPHHKHLTALVRPEVLSRLAGIEAGEIDTVPGLGINDVKPFLDDDGFKVVFQAAGAASVHNIYPNLNNPVMEDGSPNPFLDPRVRLAANLAINRQAVIDGLLAGQGNQPLFTFSGAVGYPNAEQLKEVTFAYDPERARALMAEAGYPDGFDTTLHLPEGFGQNVDEYTLIAQQDLAAIGIRLTLRQVTSGEYFTDAEVRARPGKPGLWWFFANTNPDIGSMTACCVDPAGPYAVAPGSPKIQDLFARQKVEQDPERRKELIAEMFLEHAREVTFIFFVEPKEAVITRADINWPKGGANGTLWEGSHYATQKLI